MPELLTLVKYAKYCKCSPAAVTKLLKAGRIDTALVNVPGKVKPLIDVAKADKIRKDSFHPSYQKVSKKKDAKQKAIKAAGVGKGKDQSWNEARRQHEWYKTALKKLELEEKKGELIPAAEVGEAWEKMVVAAKTKILGIKSKCAPIIIDLVEDIEDRETILKIIDSAAREALTDLAKG